MDTPDAEGVKDIVPPVYRWFYASAPDGTIGTDSTTYTVTAADAGEVIGVGVTYTDNNDVSFEVTTMLDAVNEVGYIVPNPDGENTITIPGTQGMEVDAGDGSDTITSGTGDDTIIGGLGDDTIDLGTGEDEDTVVYTIGGQTAQDGGDGIANFKRGQDKFVFSLESNTETMALEDMADFINYINNGTPDDISDDQFYVLFALDLPTDPAEEVEVRGLYLHFNDSVFYSGGRISMPIVVIQFSENLSKKEVVNLFGGEIQDHVRGGILTNLDYLDDLFGGEDSVGFQVDMV